MSKRKSYYENFSTSSLFALLKQSYIELELFEEKKETRELKKAIFELEVLIRRIKKIIENRYIEEEASINRIATDYLNCDPYFKEVYKDIFLTRLLTADEFVDVNLINRVINTLDIEDIFIIMNSKEDSIYGKLASKRYDKMVFEVEEDVYNDYVLKNENDSLYIEEKRLIKEGRF